MVGRPPAQRVRLQFAYLIQVRSLEDNRVALATCKGRWEWVDKLLLRHWLFNRFHVDHVVGDAGVGGDGGRRSMRGSGMVVQDMVGTVGGGGDANG